jgi:hypothetical protein
MKLSLCLNWASRYEGVLGELKYSSAHSLPRTLDGGKWSASRPGRFTPRERAPGTQWVGGWVGLLSRSAHRGEEKNSQPLPGLEPPIMQPVAQRCTTELPRLICIRDSRKTNSSWQDCFTGLKLFSYFSNMCFSIIKRCGDYVITCQKGQ